MAVVLRSVKTGLLTIVCCPRRSSGIMTEILIFSYALIKNMVPSRVEAANPTIGVGCG